MAEPAPERVEALRELLLAPVDPVLADPTRFRVLAAMASGTQAYFAACAKGTLRRLRVMSSAWSSGSEGSSEAPTKLSDPFT